MNTINSFDIFDTLLTRRVKKPTDIFYIIQTQYNIDNFYINRINAEKLSNGTFDDIYNQYAKLLNISQQETEKLKEIEILTELEHIIPIKTNLNKVQNNDILISDMYLDEKVLQKFLTRVGLDKTNKIYVTPDGKHKGYIYKKILETHQIKIHTGDNLHSDIYMAKKHGIIPFHTSSHQFTKLENEISLDLANIIREFRLKNPFCEGSFEHELYEEQCRCNILMLSVFACQINWIINNEQLDKILFVTRDCCLLEKLFSCLFPLQKTETYHNSRLINENYSQEYIEYVKNIYNEKSIIIDLNGSFKTGRLFFQKEIGELPRVHLLCYNQSAPKYNKLSYACEHTMDDYIELLNADVKGTLIDYKNKKFLRKTNENNTEIIQIIHSTIEQFIKFLSDKQLEQKYITYCNNILYDKTLYTKLFSNYYFTHSYQGQIKN